MSPRPPARAVGGDRAASAARARALAGRRGESRRVMSIAQGGAPAPLSRADRRRGTPRARAASGGPTFRRDPAFHRALRERVDEYFRASGQSPRDCWQMYVKATACFAGFAGAYVLLVFVARTWVEALPLAILLGLAIA